MSDAQKQAALLSALLEQYATVDSDGGITWKNLPAFVRAHLPAVLENLDKPDADRCVEAVKEGLAKFLQSNGITPETAVLLAEAPASLQAEQGIKNLFHNGTLQNTTAVAAAYILLTDKFSRHTRHESILERLFGCFKRKKQDNGLSRIKVQWAIDAANELARRSIQT